MLYSVEEYLLHLLSGPVEPFVLDCQEIVDEFFGGVRCTYSGAVGRVSFSCSYDNGPLEDCE